MKRMIRKRNRKKGLPRVKTRFFWGGAVCLTALLLSLALPQQARADSDKITITVDSLQAERCEFKVTIGETSRLTFFYTEYNESNKIFLDTLTDADSAVLKMAYGNESDSLHDFSIEIFSCEEEAWSMKSRSYITIGEQSIHATTINTGYQKDLLFTKGDCIPDTQYILCVAAVVDNKPEISCMTFKTLKLPTVQTCPTLTLEYGKTRKDCIVGDDGVAVDGNGDKLEGTWTLKSDGGSVKPDWKQDTTAGVEFKPVNTDYGSIEVHVKLEYIPKPITVTVKDYADDYGTALLQVTDVVEVPEDQLVKEKSFGPDDTVSTVTDALSISWDKDPGAKPIPGNYGFKITSSCERYDITFVYESGNKGNYTVKTGSYKPPAGPSNNGSSTESASGSSSSDPDLTDVSGFEVSFMEYADVADTQEDLTTAAAESSQPETSVKEEETSVSEESTQAMISSEIAEDGNTAETESVSSDMGTEEMPEEDAVNEESGSSILWVIIVIGGMGIMVSCGILFIVKKKKRNI